MYAFLRGELESFIAGSEILDHARACMLLVVVVVVVVGEGEEGEA